LANAICVAEHNRKSFLGLEFDQMFYTDL
jgi:hypothetical protein